MTITVILIVILLSFIIVHHIYKVKDKLDKQFKDLRYYKNHIIESIDRIELSLYKIDSNVDDIKDEIKKRKIKYIKNQIFINILFNLKFYVKLCLKNIMMK